MPGYLETIARLEREGRYAELVTSIDFGKLDALPQEHRVTLAHALFHAGRAAEAMQICRRENSESSPPKVRSRCELIAGLVSRRNANLDAAVRHLNSALIIAKESKDPIQIAWTAIQQFRLAAELQPGEELAALLRQVRLYVTRAGDPHVTAYMHDAMALMETSRGCLPEARRHQTVSAAILKSYPNAWLSQIGHIGLAYVDYFDGKYAEAIEHLRLARLLLPLTGSSQAAIIDCNEGHALAAVGRFNEAIGRLSGVCSTAPLLFTVGALEGLARVYLATDRLDQCAEALDRIDALCADSVRTGSALGSRWAAVTRTKLLLRKGEWRAAADEADRNLLRATQLRDPFLISTLFALLAEALARCDDTTGSIRALLRAIDGAEGLSEQQSTCNRAAAAILDSSGHELAAFAMERAEAVWSEQGNKCNPRELPRLSSSRFTTSRATPRASSGALRVVNAIGGAFGLAQNRRLLGIELINALLGLACTPHAELITSEQERSSARGRADLCVLDLGEHRNRQLALVCKVPDDPAKAVLLSDVLRIGRAALQLERYREEERSRAALWPADPVEEQTGALFLAEEMQTLLATARRIAATSVPVLITGETGTGKEVLARTIHACSARAAATFLPFNCASVPRDMLDAQLFGHRRGAFTGATEHFPGVIRASTGGTLFLDEIGEIGLDLQPKLLRFLESGDVHPLGETHPAHVDVRIMAATNADLDALVAEGRFREDLFYRLNIVRLHVPPLRERRVEIPALATRYLERHAREWHKGNLRLAEETVEYLLLYRWPGNVRQLANEMRRLAALAEHDAVLMPEHLSPEIAASRRTLPPSERALDPTELVVRLDQPLAAAVEHLERTMVQNALRACGGRVEEAAARLGLSRKGLYLKRQRFGILGTGTPSPPA